MTAMTAKQKIHTTNYFDTFIEIAEDCPTGKGEKPPTGDKQRSIAAMQYEILSRHPYEFTSDDVLFQVWADRQDLPESERSAARKEFFSKGQPCFRSSPLTKRYGWGIHSNEKGKIAMYGAETKEYEQFVKSGCKTVKAMRSKRA
jgi:hypothetical protein